MAFAWRKQLVTAALPNLNLEAHTLWTSVSASIKSCKASTWVRSCKRAWRVNSPGSAGRRVGNGDNEDSRAEIKALPECQWMWSSTVRYVLAVVMLTLEKKYYGIGVEQRPPKAPARVQLFVLRANHHVVSHHFVVWSRDAHDCLQIIGSCCSTGWDRSQRRHILEICLVAAAMSRIWQYNSWSVLSLLQFLLISLLKFYRDLLCDFVPRFGRVVNALVSLESTLELVWIRLGCRQVA